MSADPHLDIAVLHDGLAAGYDQSALGLFAFVADHLLSQLRVRRGAKLLDVGAGTGAVALAAAPMVAPGGRVTAVDLSDGMLERLQGKAVRMGIDNVDVHVMDAGALEFRRGYFDYVTASFVLEQLPDPGRAVAHWLRVLKPGGELVLATPAADAFAPPMAHLRATLRGLGVPLAPSPLAEPEACRALLVGAGAVAVDVTVRDFGYHLDGAEEWWSILWASGLFPALHALDPPTLGRLRQIHLGHVAGEAGSAGIALRAPVVLARARAA